MTEIIATKEGKATHTQFAIVWQLLRIDWRIANRSAHVGGKAQGPTFFHKTSMPQWGRGCSCASPSFSFVNREKDFESGEIDDKYPFALFISINFL
jgi:hypothetical protein